MGLIDAVRVWGLAAVHQIRNVEGFVMADENDVNEKTSCRRGIQVELTQLGQAW